MKKYQQEIEELRKLLEQGTQSSDEDEEDDNEDDNAVVLVNENGSPTKKLKEPKRKATSEQELGEMKAKIEDERKKLKDAKNMAEEVRFSKTI